MKASLLGLLGVLTARIFERFGFSTGLVAALALLFCATGILALLRKQTGALSLFSALALIAAEAVAFRIDGLVRTRLPETVLEVQCVVVGRLECDPSLIGRTYRFTMTVQHLGAEHGQWTGEVRVATTMRVDRSAAPRPLLQSGQRIVFRGRVYNPPADRNPGEFNTREYLRANGISYQCVGRGDILTLDSPPSCRLLVWCIDVPRRFLLQQIDRYVGGEEGEFLKGLLLGERSGLSPGTRQAFVTSGVAHVLAVSGSNVAVIAMLFLGLARLCRLPRFLQHALAGIGLLWYMLITGAQAPVVRATVMGWVFLAASCSEEKHHALNALGISGVALLGFAPHSLFDAGFQLSYGAVASLIFIYPPLFAFLGRTLGPLARNTLTRNILGVVCASVAATLGTLPLAASFFGEVSVIGILVNAIVVPASGFGVVLGLLLPAVGFFTSSGAEIVGHAAWLLLRVTLNVSVSAASVPFASLGSLHLGTPFALCYYLFLAIGVRGLRGGSIRQGLLLLLAALNVTALLPENSQDTRRQGILRVSVIDVGQGDAICIETPSGRVVVIDCGPVLPVPDIARRVLVPFLSRRGIHRIDHLILTHAHSDHLGGCRGLVESLAVGSVISASPAALGLAFRLGCDTASAHAGEILQLESSVRFYVLSPERTARRYGAAQADGGNHQSVVIQVRYGETAILLAGDAETEEESRMADRFGEMMRSDVLKVAHHGAATGTTAGFLRRVAPRIAVLSVGRENRFSHPSDSVIMRLESTVDTVLRTDRDGAIVLESDGSRLGIVEWRGREYDD